MDRKTTELTEVLHRYLLEHSFPLDDVARALIADTERLGEPASMQIAPEQGIFLQLLTAVIGPRRALEIGTFTGYSALCIARGLPDDGTLLCCDVSEEWTAIARPHWQRAGVAHKIELRIAPALETLAALPDDARFALAFIDADKRSYPAYLEAVVPRLEINGVLLADNVLWSGRVVDGSADEDVEGIRAFNDAVAAEARLEAVLLPFFDGLTFARRVG